MCHPNFEDNANILYVNELEPLTECPSPNYNIKVGMGSDKEKHFNSVGQSITKEVSNINNNNDKVTFIRSHRPGTNPIPKARNTIDESAANGRKRLISLQTSFEDEPSETSICSSSECVVTEVTKLGNGKIKKTVYRYNIERPQTKERLYSI